MQLRMAQQYENSEKYDLDKFVEGGMNTGAGASSSTLSRECYSHDNSADDSLVECFIVSITNSEFS
jgi:hypothetical protein